MEEEILRTEGLSFFYEEGIPALNQISVAIHKHEKIAVLGANGAGKSTFFLNLNGVREPASGAVYLHGEKIGKKTRNELRKSVGIVFQDADSQIIASTVKAEIAFGPLNLKLPREEVESRTERAIEQMKLQTMAGRPPHYLSGGEKKRVTIADILAMESEIIIFDEPTASLDPVNAEMLENILGELKREGKTILLSTHDVDFAYRFADRILVFWEGRLLADGNATEIFQNAELLRKTNLVKPVLLQVFEMLEREGLTGAAKEYPRTLMDIEKILKERKR
ncbi:MAG: ABC transporter ATP-binding protein [Lachnospiraceae bacterium]